MDVIQDRDASSKPDVAGSEQIINSHEEIVNPTASSSKPENSTSEQIVNSYEAPLNVLQPVSEEKKKKRTRRGKKSSAKSAQGNTNQEGCEGISTESHMQNPQDKPVTYHFLPDNLDVLWKAVASLSTSPNSVVGSSSVSPQTQAAIGSDSIPRKKIKKKKDTSKKQYATDGFQQSPVQSNKNNGAGQSQDSPAENTPQQKNSQGSSKKSSKKNKKTAEKPFEEYLTPEEAMAGIQNNILISGNLRINPKCYIEAYITAPDKGQDILILGTRNRNRALEGDEVFICLNPESEWKVQGSNKQRTGKVVFIKDKIHSRVAVGFLKPLHENQDWALFSPRDARVPRIRIPIAKCPAGFLKQPDLYKKTLFLARIDDWQIVQYAVGDLLETIGEYGDLQCETQALLSENDIDITPYDINLYQYFPSIPYVIPEEEISSRADLRKDCIFTIDPLTARDLDDAVSCKKLENGNFLVGVHISDVSFFLKEGTPLDYAVSNRATSTYLVASVQHMLPREMCLLCSLLPGEDKLTFSVFWEMTPEAKIIKHYFTRSVINSCTQLAYEHAQAMLENPDKDWSTDELPKIFGNYSPKDLSLVVNQLNSLADVMREERFSGGALKIDQPKLIFSLEPGTGYPLSFTIHENKDSNRMIEEFMLLANMTVATQLNTDFPDLAFLRCHPSPHEYIMDELKKSMEHMGIFLDVKSAGGLQNSMWRYGGDDFVSQARMMVLNNLCAKPMARAKYFCAPFQEDEKDYWHYALNVPLYTHFTSPIRRYADVMVHRLLCASLKYSPKPDWLPDDVHKIAVTCNKQKYLAKRAGEQSMELYLSMHIGMHSPMVELAVVMDVKDFSFDVIICSMGLVQRIYTNNMPRGTCRVVCKKRQNKIISQEIHWQRNRKLPFITTQTVEMFSILAVELTRSPVTFKIESRLLRPTGPGVLPL